jgi:hypothetical protein
MAGQNGSNRLDRIERALSLLPGYRAQFREQHELLLSAQTALSNRLDKLAERLDKPMEFGSRTDERLRALAALVDKPIHRQQ